MAQFLIEKTLIGAALLLTAGFGIAVGIKHVEDKGGASGRHAGPQAIIDGGQAKPPVMVTHLNVAGGADQAREIVGYNPLDRLDEQAIPGAALAGLGEFAQADPVFTLKIQAPDIDVALSSLRKIYSQIKPSDAQALDFAVRFLAVTKLKGSEFAAYGQDPSAIPDQALYKHILPLIDGKTPMEVMVAARNEQLRLKEARKKIPVDPFDRMELERQGQLPGITLPR